MKSRPVLNVQRGNYVVESRKETKTMKSLMKWLFAFAVVFCGVVQQAAAQITNPSFTAVSTTVGNGFNVGLAVAVAAAVALLVFGYFFRAARKR